MSRVDPAIVEIFTKRKQTSRKRVPFSIPLDHSLLAINWPALLRAQRAKHLRKLQRKRLRPVVRGGHIAAQSVDAGLPGKREQVHLRRLLGSARLTGASTKARSRLDRISRQTRTFLVNATDRDLAVWWRRLYTRLPEPIFLLVYATLQAVA